MRELHLQHNSLKKLPETLGSMSALELLDVSNNALTDLPESTGALDALVVLRARDNKIARLPRYRSVHPLQQHLCYQPSSRWIYSCPRSCHASRSLHRLKRHLKVLMLHGNPCDDPPADLCVHDSVSSITSYVYNAQSTEGMCIKLLTVHVLYY